jgi:hypothetical protein
MAKSITGTAGSQFNLTIADTATNTGTKTVNFTTESAIRSVTYTNASLVAVYSGQVGTTGTEIDLSSLIDFDDGTYYLRLQENSAPVALSSVLTIIIHNKSTADTITVTPGASNSFLAASEQITIDPGSCVQLTFASGKTVSSTVKTLTLTGDADPVNCEIYILGN